MKLNIVSSLFAGLLITACAKPAPMAKATDKGQEGSRLPPEENAGRLPPGQVVATWNGGKLTYGDLESKAEGRLDALKRKYLQDLYGQEKQLIEMVVVEQLVEAEAKKSNLSADEYMKQKVGEPKPTEEEIEKFYKERVAGSPGAGDLASMKPRIEQFLQGEKAREAISAEITRLKEAAGLKLSLPEPSGLKVKFDLAGKPTKGPENAKVHIVEFSDFECPYCSRAVEPIEALLKAFPNDVKITFMNFPLSFHARAMPSAIAAACAGQQGKFWEMHDKLFGNQAKLDEETFNSYATELGLKDEAFKACLKDPKTQETIAAEMKQGQSAGVGGTPSFYLNGVPARGIPSKADIEALLN